jgi:hypothetical protein
MDKDVASKPRDRDADMAGNSQRLPTVSGVEYFSRSQTRSSTDDQQEGREGRDWLKERAFRYAERVLFAAGAADELKVRDDEGRRSASGAEGEVGDDPQPPQAEPNPMWRRMLLRWCRRILEVRAVTQLTDQLSQCVGNAHAFDFPWQLEFVVSNRMLARTEVTLRCDPPALHLRLDCPDEHSRRLLENNVLLLHSRLGSLSRYRLTVEIEQADKMRSDVNEGGPA